MSWTVDPHKSLAPLDLSPAVARFPDPFALGLNAQLLREKGRSPKTLWGRFGLLDIDDLEPGRLPQ